MTATEAKNLRQQMKLSVPDLSRLIGIPPRTVQSYELGERKVPKDYRARLDGVQATMDLTMRRIINNLNDRLDRLYPNGIPGAKSEEIDG